MEQDHIISSEGTPARMGQTERTLSAIAGSLLLYYVTKKHKGDALLLTGAGYLLYRAVSGHCPVSGIFHRKGERSGHVRNINVRTSVVVSRPREEVYLFWRNLENLPLFMRHLDNVDVIDPVSSAWRVRMPGGIGDVRWEAEIVRDVPGTELSWASVPGASIENVGKVNFSDTPGGATRVDVLISYRAPGGVIGERLSRLLTPLFRDMIGKDIRGFKHFMENIGVEGV
ncbi:MAG TPA: SRPBCC family protein [Puia sp.]|jgi:uncharacterized membrane protein